MVIVSKPNLDTWPNSCSDEGTDADVGGSGNPEPGISHFCAAGLWELWFHFREKARGIGPV